MWVLQCSLSLQTILLRMLCIPVTPVSATEYQNKLHSCRERSYLRTQQEKRKILCLRGQKAASISSIVDYICPCMFNSVWVQFLNVLSAVWCTLWSAGWKWIFPVSFCLSDYGPALFGPSKNSSSELPNKVVWTPFVLSSFALLLCFIFSLHWSKEWDVEVRCSGSHLLWKAEAAQWFPEQPVLVRQQQQKWELL